MHETLLTRECILTRIKHPGILDTILPPPPDIVSLAISRSCIKRKITQQWPCKIEYASFAVSEYTGNVSKMVVDLEYNRDFSGLPFTVTTFNY